MSIPYIEELEKGFKSSVLMDPPPEKIFLANSELLSLVIKRLSLVKNMILLVISQMENQRQGIITDRVSMARQQDPNCINFSNKSSMYIDPLMQLCFDYEEFGMPELDFSQSGGEANIKLLYGEANTYINRFLYYIKTIYDANVYPELNSWLKRLMDDIDKLFFRIVYTPQETEYIWPDNGFYLTTSGHIYRKPPDYAYKKSSIEHHINCLFNEIHRLQNAIKRENVTMRIHYLSPIWKINRLKLKQISISGRLSFKIPSDSVLNVIRFEAVLGKQTVLKPATHRNLDISTSSHELLLHKLELINQEIRDIDIKRGVSQEDFYRFLNREFKENVLKPGYIFDKTAVSLYVGYLYALKETLEKLETIFFKSSNSFSEAYGNMFDFIRCHDFYQPETIIQLLGLHKVEVGEGGTRKIVTSSLNAVELFSEYLNRGWTVEIFPPLQYYNNQFTRINLEECEELINSVNNYIGPGKIMIHGFNNEPNSRILSFMQTGSN